MDYERVMEQLEKHIDRDNVLITELREKIKVLENRIESLEEQHK